MGAFWDERAREDAFFFVDDRLEYGAPDRERFWADGPETVDRVLGLVDAPPIAADAVVVEIGCGLGRLTRVLAERGGRVEAFDVSAEMLAQARELNPALAGRVTWRHGDGTSLRPLADASADVVFSHVVFQHVPDPRITLGYVAEMGRVLRPGGWAAFQVSTDPAVHERPAPLRRRVLAKLGRAPQGQDDPRWLGSAVGLEALDATARQVGLEVDRIFGAGTQFTIVRATRAA